jgi:hypothetical protein
MRKSVMFISASLTAFVLAVLVGIVYAYRGLSLPDRSQQPSDSAPLPVSSPTATVPPVVSPQDAALFAAKYLNRTDLYSVELADFNGVQTYKVIFSSGDTVYVGMDGRILSAIAPQPAVIISVAPATGHSSGGNSRAGGEREDGGHDD